MFLPIAEASFQTLGQNLACWLYTGNINTVRFCIIVMSNLQNIQWRVYGWKAKSALQTRFADRFLLCWKSRRMKCGPAQTFNELFFLQSNAFVILHCKWMWRTAVDLYRHPSCHQGRKWPETELEKRNELLWKLAECCWWVTAGILVGFQTTLCLFKKTEILL